MTTVTERGPGSEIDEAARIREIVSEPQAPDRAGGAPTQVAEPAPAKTPSPPATAAVPPTPVATRPKSKRGRLLFLIPILLLALAGGLYFGYRSWYEATYFVSTDNASVTGDLVQVGSLNAGRIVTTRVDVGDRVQRGQELAVIAMPQQVGASQSGTAPKVDITGTVDTQVPVVSQTDGVVAARMGFVGGTVAAGQPIFSLVDPRQSWVRANIEESSVWRLATGQPVEVHVDALNRDFNGRVEAISPASSATFSLLPTGNASGNFTKVTQYVPIKVAVDSGDTVLPLGTSVEVRVRVRETSQSFPLPWRP